MEKRLLKRQAEDLQIQLDAVRKRIGEIDGAPASS
jgi:prefoldin subunit 5